MKKGVLFDLDGTLWDSSKEVIDSWILALKDCPDITKKPTVRDMQSVMGKVMDEIGDILLAEASLKRRREVLDYCMDVENAYIRKHGGQLHAGLEEMLKELKDKQYHLSIVSNCQKGYIEAFFEYHGLAGYFDDYESYGNTGRLKGENIRLVTERNHLDAAVYVGDTQGDYEAAMEAGLPFIHARTGYGQLEAETPVIQELAQLPDLVEKILGEKHEAGD